MTTRQGSRTMVAAALLAAFAVGCGGGTDPAAPGTGPVTEHDGTLRTAAIDYEGTPVDDPEVAAAYVRADLLILQPWRYWQQDAAAGELDRLRAANPDVRILAYFNPMNVYLAWGDEPRDSHPYTYDLYQAVRNHFAHTTTGDTVSNWPGKAVVLYTHADVRAAMLDVFASYQGTNGNRFDGIFWDNFTMTLGISPAVTNMEGEPDLDGDGIAYRDDADEQTAFRTGQNAWVGDVRARFGEGFIQVANGSRARLDAAFAAELDGMYQELFPTVTYGASDGFAQALDPARADNLAGLVARFRTRNGGPWVILSNLSNVGSIQLQSGELYRVVPGDFNRVMALLTGTASLYFDMSGKQRPGLPAVELDLGRPLGPTEGTSGIFTRDFERGTVRVQMESGGYPVPFRFWIRDGEGRNVQVFDPPYVYP